MPYKDKAKQREANRRNTAKWRNSQGITKNPVIPTPQARTEQINSEVLKSHN